MGKLLSITLNFEDEVRVITGIDQEGNDILAMEVPPENVITIPKTLTLKDIFNRIDAYSGYVRRIILKKVIDELSRLSKNQIAEIQEKFKPDDDFQKFVEEQNKAIKACIKIEISEPGIKIRKKMGLKLLSWETPFNWEL